MAVEDRKKSLWHAFDSLDFHRKGECMKSQLKVLSHNVASAVGIQDIEAKFDEHFKANTINFDEYSMFMEYEVFSHLRTVDSEPMAVLRKKLTKIDEVCWFVCCNKFTGQQMELKLSNDSCFQLWCIFNLLAEMDEDNNSRIPVVIDHEEVLYLINKTQTTLGHETDAELPVELTQKVTDTGCHLFGQFLDVLEEALRDDSSRNGLNSAVLELNEDFIIEVRKKGYLMKKGPVTSKERWLVLTPHAIRYFTNRDEKDLKGEICLTKACKAEALPEKGSQKLPRFSVVTSGKTYELSAQDARTRDEWVAAIQVAVDASDTLVYKQQKAFQMRSKQRNAQRAKQQEEEEKRRAEEERRKAEEVQRERELEATREQVATMQREKEELERLKNKMMEKSARELEQEKMAKEEVEAQLLREMALREAERRYVKELQDMKRELEELLEAERQAKKDEEIVRILQARLLEEEQEKREELEKSRNDLEETLQEERQRLEGQEQQLREEQLKLEQLEAERLAADAQRHDALAKLAKAEKSRSELQAKLKEKSEVFRMISHRGLGAFSEADFSKRSRRYTVDLSFCS